MFSGEDIERLLSEINNGLREQGTEGTVVLAGGAVMTMVLQSRSMTFDIDALLEPADKIREVAKQIAFDENLKEGWINDGVKGFVDTSKMNTLLVKQYSNLEVRRFDNESLLAMKLSSARDNDNKDFHDAVRLMEEVGIRDMEQVYEILERYIPYRLLTPRIDYFAQAVFAQYSDNKELSIDKKPDPADIAKEARRVAAEASDDLSCPPEKRRHQ